MNRLLGIVLDVEYLFTCVHREEDADTKQVYFYLFKVRRPHLERLAFPFVCPDAAGHGQLALGLNLLSQGLAMSLREPAELPLCFLPVLWNCSETVNIYTTGTGQRSTRQQLKVGRGA